MKCPECHFDNPSDSKFCKECGTQLILSEGASISPTKTLETPTEELTRGTTFAGRYEIIEELGKGGMGKVYRAEDKKIKEEVALKLIKTEIASDKKTIERFSNELKMARKIAHRNVCRMYDLGEEKGTHFITMEYVPGEDLKRLVRKVGQFSAGKTISIAKQVCEGLAEAHRLGVVHRDLKPQNIMVDEDGNARIMDFGIARSVKGKGITGAGVMIGTPEYMSPEQAEVKEVDQRSDIYSLGVILYEMVTGRVPFEGETPLSIAMKHKSEMPKDPRELNSQIPEDLSRVILRCLEKDKEKRYQSAGEVQSELENIEKGIPTTERIIPKRKTITSREITVTFGLKKLFIPA
jgi:serine/threonine-protein kinase